MSQSMPAIRSTTSRSLPLANGRPAQKRGLAQSIRRLMAQR
jgi:hypothetical protein